MAQYFTDFSEYTTGSQPDDWSPFYASDGAWTVVEDATALGGKALRGEDQSTSGLRGLLWDDVNSDPARANVEAVIRYKLNSASATALVFLLVRGSGSWHTTDASYYAGSQALNKRRIVKRVSGAATTLEEVSYALSTGVWAWMRVRVAGSSLTVKHWLDSESEPSAWTFESTQSELSDAGFVGIAIGAGTSTPKTIATFDVFGVGTGGDSAPTSALGPSAVAFSGTVPNQAGTEGTPFSLSLASYFSGTETPFSYSLQSGTLPAGLSLSSSTGAITGTPTTVGTSSGIVVRATDSASNTADTNSFSITIDDALSPPSSAPGSTVATAVSSSQIDISFAAVSGATGYDIERDGEATPLDLGNVLAYSHTGLAAESPHSYRVRAYNAAGDGPWSASFGDTTGAESVAVKGVTITLYAGSTPQASITGIRALWWDATAPDSTAPDYYTAIASTDGSGVLTLDIDSTTALDVGDYGYLLLHKDGTLVNEYRDALAFQGAVQITDIS